MDSVQNSSRNSSRARSILIITGYVLFMVVAAIIVGKYVDQDNLQVMVDNYGPLGVVVFLLIEVFYVTFTPLLNTAIYITSGFLFGGVRTDIPNNTPKFFQIQTEMESLVETANDTLLLAVLASDVAKIKKDEAVAIRVLPDQTEVRGIFHSTIPRFVNNLTLGIESYLESKYSLTPRTKYLLCV